MQFCKLEPVDGIFHYLLFILAGTVYVKDNQILTYLDHPFLQVFLGFHLGQVHPFLLMNREHPGCHVHL